MDSISHTRVANLLLAHIQENAGVTFDANAFRYGNLKPDLTGTYLTKRHYPSLMFDEVMDKLRAFCSNYTLRDANGRDLSVDLGEICHYLTDFFCYPHNDDLYPHGLLAHYIYEKRVAMRLSRSLTKEHFEGWVDGVVAPYTVEGLISRIQALHDKYRALVVAASNGHLYNQAVCLGRRAKYPAFVMNHGKFSFFSVVFWFESEKQAGLTAPPAGSRFAFLFGRRFFFRLVRGLLLGLGLVDFGLLSSCCAGLGTRAGVTVQCVVTVLAHHLVQLVHRLELGLVINLLALLLADHCRSQRTCASQCTHKGDAITKFFFHFFVHLCQ